MPKDEQEPLNAKTGKRWFRPNQSGPGWHPSSWQGWLILAVVVGAIVVVAVLFRTGVL